MPTLDENVASNELSKQVHDEVSLRAFIEIIRQNLVLIGLVTFLFLLFSIVYSLQQPNVYTADTLLAPVDDGAPSSISSIAGQFGGLASLAGINLASGGGEKVTLAVEMLKSRAFITKFIERHQLLVPLMASKGWDRGKDKLVYDDDIYDDKLAEWKFKSKKSPTNWEAVKKFRSIYSVNKNKTTGYITLRVSFYSPTIAKEWLELIVKDINTEIKNREVAEAEKTIEYLNEQLEKIAITEVKSIFYKLIDSQYKTIMLAEVKDEFVLTMVDPPVIPEEKSSPRRSLIVLVFGFLGMCLSLVIVFLRYLYEKRIL